MSTRVLAFLAVALGGLGFAPEAGAHAFPTPTYVATDAISTVELSVPNERRRTMTSFELVAPAGLNIADVVATEGWTSAATPRRATWSGGGLPAFASTTFALKLAVDREPGTVVLEIVERYADGASVRWPVTLVVTPADEPSPQLGIALVVGLAGLLALTIGGALLWRRAGRSLQER